MPKYDYKCQMCNAMAEIDIKITEDAIAPMCCHIPMQRDYTAPGVIFKGTGWEAQSDTQN